MGDHSKDEKKKGFFAKLVDKLDKKLEEKAKVQPCCCSSSSKKKDDSCCK